MALPKPKKQEPTQIGTIVVILKDVPARVDPVRGDREAAQTVTYEFEILDNENRRIVSDVDSGDLAPHLSAGQINQLKNFMTNLRSRAVDEVVEKVVATKSVARRVAVKGNKK